MALDTSAFTQQAEWCEALGSPFTAAVLHALIPILGQNSETGRLVCDWPGTAGPLRDVVPLRLTGAFHSLVLSQSAPELAALYPPNPMPDAQHLQDALAAALHSHDADVAGFLQHAPQTNEVARAAVLLAGLSTIASRCNLPLALFEIGASGGLNLNLDRFSCTLGDSHLGTPDSPVKLAPPWTGNGPKQTPTIAARAGCDLNPIDVAKPDEALRLLSYIWPDQPERLSRTRAAIALAQTHANRIDAADAADWVARQMPQDRPGQTRVLFHSIAWQYMPASVQSHITQTMETAGAEATENNPLAWLSFELGPNGGADLCLRLWPQAPQVQTLAHSNPHVRSVTWVAD